MNPDVTPEEELANELRALRMPPDLLPLDESAGQAIHRARVLRGRRALVAVVLAFAVITATSLTLSGKGERPSGDPAPSDSASGAPTEVLPDGQVPHPGGGARMLEAFTDYGGADPFNPDVNYLLDRETGGYYRVPFAVLPSPDGETVAVHAVEDSDHGLRWGVANRREYLHRGAAAVTWFEPTDRQGGYDPLGEWSPDGTRLTTVSYKRVGDGVLGADTRANELRTYDTTGGRTVVTAIPDGVDLVSFTWKPDGSGWTFLERTDGGRGRLRDLAFDGTLGSPMLVKGEDVGLFGAYALVGYSPDGRYFVYTYRTRSSESMGGIGGYQVVLDAATWQQVGEDVVTIDWDNGSESRVLGWYDAKTLFRLTWHRDERRLEFVDAATGGIVRTIDDWRVTERAVFGPCTGLPPDATDLCF